VVWQDAVGCTPVGVLMQHVDQLPGALQRYYTQNLNHIFPEKELRGHSPNSYIQISVCDFYIPTIGPHILLQENRWTDRGNK
jgi:hypothetical protein